jgi:hypothetical protein
MCLSKARVLTAMVVLSLMTSTMMGTALARGGRGGGGRSATHGGRFTSHTATGVGHNDRRIGRPGWGPYRNVGPFRNPNRGGPYGPFNNPVGRPPRAGQPGAGRPAASQPQPTAEGGLRPPAQQQTIPRDDSHKINSIRRNFWGGHGVYWLWW